MTLDKFEEASEVVKNVTSETKLVYSEYWSRQTGNKIYLKPENMQYTGAYKVRGSYYKISTLSDHDKDAQRYAEHPGQEGKTGFQRNQCGSVL